MWLHSPMAVRYTVAATSVSRPTGRSAWASFASTILQCPSMGTARGPIRARANPLGVGGEALHGWALPPGRFNRCSGRTAARRASTTTSCSAGSTTSERGSWVATCSDRSAAHGPMTAGRGGGATTRRITRRSSCSPIIPARRSPWTAARRSTSSRTGSTRPCSARAKPRAAKDVRLGGGVSTIRQYLSAGLIDEMHLAVAPVLLGSGEHLLGGLDVDQARLSGVRARPGAQCHARRYGEGRLRRAGRMS